MELFRPYFLRGVCYACLRFLDPRTAEHMGGHLFHHSCLEYLIATSPQEQEEDGEETDDFQKEDR